MASDRHVTLGARLRARRAARQLTLRALAERSGLSERYLLLAEQGRANLSLDKLDALADALEWSVEQLLSTGGRGELDTLLAARSDAELVEVLSWVRRRFAPTGVHMVALLGVRGAGKSTVGRALARRLHREFVELDREIELAADLSLAQIFSVHGEAYYRRLEQEALVRWALDGRPTVVATGGSIVTDAENFGRLREAALTVWLRATPEEHWDRVIQQGDRRPMRDHPHALAELRALLAAREPLYRQADVVVDTSSRPVAEVVEEVALAVEAAEARV
ncbi:MAG: shikimate kinase [Bradymonadia bacterium]